ncbi:MAG: hypothetical protein BWY11_02340 [Firmicutes bacterium ADurb.Bin182]|nr:MAG: hypothetical protein BWY11_02340 [Firmicutes bacterium ADurb.Bin182]
MNAKKGDWVQIHQIVLEPSGRAPTVPEDTKKVPLELWVKGYALHDSKIGENVEIRTITGRKASGELTAVNPSYKHSFGDFVPELLQIGKQVKGILYGDEYDER